MAASLGKMPTDSGAALDLLVEALQQVHAPDLAPVGLKEAAGRELVLLGIQNKLGSPGKTLRQRGGQVITAAFNLAGVFLGKHRAKGQG